MSTKTTTPAAQATESTEQKKDWGHIKSYVHRSVHMTPSQKKALEGELYDTWCLPYEASIINYEDIFKRSAPTILEIGFGMGETTAKIAQASADKNFIGVEVFSGGVGALLNRIDNEGIENIRIIQHDAVDVVNHMIAPNSLDGVHIYFPDPWPKKRHHKRRLVQSPFIKQLVSRIKPGGYIHCATDWEDYAMQMMEVLSAETALQNRYEEFAPRPDYRPLTKFENRGIKLGYGVWDLIFEKKA
ncbi:MAG: tRNA (guanosine(46)-N7)-methyltransferase TrmB [Alcaligenaceae bacterium]|nr:tRNA (guanosine(46)-N7)-methyltransferase TrmB [Alcaligenaceae bacterium]